LRLIPQVQLPSLARWVESRESALAHTFGATLTTTTAASTATAAQEATYDTLGDTTNTRDHPCGERKRLFRNIPNR
tara:strand:- start:1206 stop:1433 length:228 start_codon:yes stop_codon:yes gene_type:complete